MEQIRKAPNSALAMTSLFLAFQMTPTQDLWRRLDSFLQKNKLIPKDTHYDMWLMIQHFQLYTSVVNFKTKYP